MNDIQEFREQLVKFINDIRVTILSFESKKDLMVRYNNAWHKDDYHTVAVLAYVISVAINMEQEPKK